MTDIDLPVADSAYGLTQFTVTVPGTNGNLREEHGSIVVVYRRDADGWLCVPKTLSKLMM